MTKNLLLAAAAAFAVAPLSANEPVAFKPVGTFSTPTVKAVSTHSLKRDQLKAMKRSILAPGKQQAPQRADIAGVLLSENFEGWNGTTADWLPSGWKNEAKAAASSDWHVVDPAGDGYYGYQGKYVAYLNRTNSTIDQWLIGPMAINVQKGMQFSFLFNVSALFMYSLDNFNMSTLEWTGEKTVQYTMKVMARTSDEINWTTLIDFAELPEYKNMSGMEAAGMMGDQVQRFSIPLDQYVGKTVQFAFAYQGADGEDAVIDDVMVGFPRMEADYHYPLSTLFYGISKEFNAVDYSVAMACAYSPITWTSTTQVAGNTAFTWAYMGPDNENGMASGEELTLTYHTDYTNAFTTRNNWYTSPKLTVSAPGSSATSVTHFEYFQAGGAPEFEATDETGKKVLLELGVAPFDHNTEGLGVYATDEETPVPVFGYSSATDLYWTELTFGDNRQSTDAAHVEALVNYYYAPESPIVVNGGWLHAMGYGLKPGAQFKLDIIPLDAQGNCRDAEGNLYPALASATCASTNVIVEEGTGLYDDYTIPFEFMTPVAISKDDCEAFIVRLSGFYDAAQFFVPFQSMEDNYAGLSLGWVDVAMTSEGETTHKLAKVAEQTGKLQSFAIVLDALYPYLYSEEDEVTIPSSGVAELELDSYYNVAELVIDDAPAWLTVGLSGTRYDKAKLQLRASNETPQEATITIAGKGVKRAIKVKSQGNSGIAGVAAEAVGEVKAIFTAEGRRVAAMDTPGIYIVTYTNGAVEKKIVK